MNTHKNALHCILFSAATSLAILASGCAKKEPAPAAPAAPSKPAEPARPATPPAPAAPTVPAVSTPAATKSDPLKSMVDTAARAAESTSAQVNEMTVPQAPIAQPTPAAAPQAPAAAPQIPASLSSSLSAAQSDAGTTSQGVGASLTASATAMQKQAEELLTRYSGELATLKSGATAMKSYVDQHPELLPEAAKAPYQQLNAMVPQLESLVGTLKDYKKADLTTLVPKLQSDFAKAKSLYSEVRALLPEKL